MVFNGFTQSYLVLKQFFHFFLIERQFGDNIPNVFLFARSSLWQNEDTTPIESLELLYWSDDWLCRPRCCGSSAAHHWHTSHWRHHTRSSGRSRWHHHTRGTWRSRRHHHTWSTWGTRRSRWRRHKRSWGTWWGRQSHPWWTWRRR